jgi:hypothetical protein
MNAAGGGDRPDIKQEPEVFPSGLEGFFQFIREARDILTWKEIAGDIDATTIKRWLPSANRECRTDRPREDSVKRVVRSIWYALAQIKKPTKGNDRLLSFLRSLFPGLPETINNESLNDAVAEFFKSLPADCSHASVGGTPPRNPKPAKDLPCTPEVCDWVDAFLGGAGFEVQAGKVALDAKFWLALDPLYRYLDALQGRAMIPNYFPGVPEIPLDGLYVELSATEDLRGNFVMADPGVLADARVADPVPLNPIHAWRQKANQKRLPLEALVSATQMMPAVVFGDPGSGKSTLLLYAVHWLARNAVRGRDTAGITAIPFRISLRDFAQNANSIDFQILQYLVRQELKVTEAHAVDHWRDLLARLFLNVRPFRLFLLIDGIDEVTPDPTAFQTIRERLKDVTSVARVIFTSRRAGFLSPVSPYAAYELVELSEMAMHDLISNWFETVHPRSTDFVQSLRRWVFADPRLHEMGTNPCLLSLLCYLNQTRQPNEFISAGCRAELYAAAVQQLTALPGLVPPSELENALETLSAFALDRYECLGSTSAPLALFNREEYRDFAARSNAAVFQITTRYLDEVWLRTRLVSRWNLGNWYHFLHLTFQEYLAAWRLVTLDEQQVAPFLEKFRDNPHWSEVWRFYAGLCSLQGPRGLTKYHRLLRCFAERKDLFNQSLFRLAPLVAEFRGADPKPILGFDLRARLEELVADGDLDPRPYLRALVEIDPAFYMERVQRVLNPWMRFYSGACSERPVNGAEISTALILLEFLHSPKAISFQQELIAAEISFSGLRHEDPELGPRISSGRNDLLGQFLEKAVLNSQGLAQERAIGYLARVRSREAGTAILEAARQSRTYGKRRPSREQIQDINDFQITCLWALCEIADLRAIDLAQELWGNREFRQTSVSEAASFLAAIRHPRVSMLAEQWVAQGSSELAEADLVALLGLMKVWPEREVPPGLEGLLFRPTAGASLKASVWGIIAQRRGIHGERELREHLKRLAQPPRSESRIGELIALLDVIIEHRFHVIVQLRELIDRAPGLGVPELEDALWAAAIVIMTEERGSPSSLAWYREVCLPRFARALQTARLNVDHISRRLAAFHTALPLIGKELAELTAVSWPHLADNARHALLTCFAASPTFAPKELLHEALLSPHPGLQGPAVEFLSIVDPGALILRRAEIPLINRLLLRRSADEGTLYFEDGYFDARKGSFVRYRNSS